MAAQGYVTCSRCKGTGRPFATARVVYAGALGTCSKCAGTGKVPGRTLKRKLDAEQAVSTVERLRAELAEELAELEWKVERARERAEAKGKEFTAEAEAKLRSSRGRRVEIARQNLAKAEGR